MSDIIAYVDGGCLNNGGPNSVAYGSYAVNDRSPVRLKFPGLTTNNQAEYQTLIALLEALPEDAHGVIYTDSALLVGQLTLGWKVRNLALRPQVDRTLALLRQRPGLRLDKAPRATISARLGH